MTSASRQPDDPKASALYVRSVEKAFAVLRAFDDGHRSMSLAEIAAQVGISKSAAQRFTHTLQALGYLAKDPVSRRWRLTPRTLDIGTAYLATDSLVDRATAHLIELNHACGESVNLSEPDGLDMVFLVRFTSHERTFVHMPVGTRIPMYCTASGRALLAAMPDDVVAETIEASSRHAFTPHTLTDVQAIGDAVVRARERGYATAEEQFYRGDLSVAAAILGPDGRPLGAVNVSCPTSRWTMADMCRDIVPHLMNSVRRISTGPSAHTRQKITNA